MRFATESKSPAAEPLSRIEFQAALGLDDAAMETFDGYAEALARWQKTINLVGPKTLADPWRRHFLDSAQLLDHLPVGAATLVDIGSGAGFPGMVLAILLKDRAGMQVQLIESDQRKCIFLNEVKRLTGAAATVHNVRAEAYGGPGGDVVTARACAPLARLLPWAAAVLRPGGRCLFLKGENVQDELTLARKDWKMQTQLHPSRSDPSGAILEVTDLAPIDDS